MTTKTATPDQQPIAAKQIPPANAGPIAPIVPPPPVAPFVFCDLATVYGFCDGVVCVTLEAVRHTVGAGGNKVHDAVVVGHLRMGLAASQSLRAALASAELLASPNGRDAGTAH